MKHLTAIMILCMLVFASCQKEPALTNAKDISYSESDFVDNEVIGLNANKDGVRRSNLKVVIRQVNNTENTYRLVLKVDSVALNADAAELDPKFEPIYSLDVVVYAGLSVTDPNNPDIDKALFTKEQMVFRKQSENGYFVYVSDPFTTDVKFDYELVGVDYTIKVQSNSLPIEVSAKSQYFILPSGKSVEQAPDIAKIRLSGPGRSGAGASAVFGKLKVTTFDDPIGEVTKIIFKGTVTGTSNKSKEDKTVPLDVLLETQDVNRTIGVNTWTNGGCISFLDPETNEWKCEDVLSSLYTNLRDAKGTFFLLDGNGRTVTTVVEDDLFSKRNLEK
jgi:hypothetical protein